MRYQLFACAKSNGADQLSYGAGKSLPLYFAVKIIQFLVLYCHLQDSNLFESGLVRNHKDRFSQETAHM